MWPRNPVVLLILALLTACGPAPVASDPTPAAASTVRVFGVDGAPLAPIDAARLRSPPDLEWGEGEAWSLAALLGEATADGIALQVRARQGTSVTFEPPFTRPEGVLALVRNKRGELAVQHVPTGEDAFHGRGGQRQRGATKTLRVTDPERILLRQAETPATGTELRLGFGDRRAITAESLADVPRVVLGAARGAPPESAPAWSLAAVLAAVDAPVGLIVLTGRGGATVTVPPAGLQDPARVPVLRLNRRGAWRFQYVDAAGAVLGDDGLRDVTELSVGSLN